VGLPNFSCPVCDVTLFRPSHRTSYSNEIGHSHSPHGPFMVQLFIHVVSPPLHGAPAAELKTASTHTTAIQTAEHLIAQGTPPILVGIFNSAHFLAHRTLVLPSTQRTCHLTSSSTNVLPFGGPPYKAPAASFPWHPTPLQIVGQCNGANAPCCFSQGPNGEYRLGRRFKWKIFRRIYMKKNCLMF